MKLRLSLKRERSQGGSLINRPMLADDLKLDSAFPYSTKEEYFDIWKGNIYEKAVSIKVFRHSETEIGALYAILAEQLLSKWAELRHRNVISFEGCVMYNPRNSLGLLSPWQEHGNAVDYLANKDTNLKLHVLVGAAKGLKCLHDNEILHGNFSGMAILISTDGTPVVTDFGIADVVNKTCGGSVSVGAVRRVPFLSRECLIGSHPSITKETDVWALGMTVFELISGVGPYFQYNDDIKVVRAIVDRELPQFSINLFADPEIINALTALCHRCWAFAPKNRSAMAENVERLAALASYDIT